MLAACSGGLAPTPTLVPVTPVPSTPPVSTPVPTPSPTPAAFPVTLRDDEGTDVTLPAAPARIVSLTPAATETLFALGVGDRVVGKVEDIAAYPPDADSLPVVATYKGVDVEKIVSLNADLVVAGGGDPSFTPVDAIQQLRRLGLPVLVLNATSVDGVLADIRHVGTAVGASPAATELAGKMRADLDRVSAATAGLPKPRVFYEIDATSSIYTVPDKSIYADMLRLAGSDPITTDQSYSISLEQLVAHNPEIILLGDDAGYTTVADVAKRPGWAGIAAVRAGAIRPVDYVLVTRPGPRLPEGLRALVEAIHPGLALPSRAP